MTLRPRALNWKTIADNYSDGLHIPVGHPGLTRLFGRNYRIEANAHVDKMEGDLVEQESENPSERAYQRLLPRVDHLPETHQRKWLYYKLFPNVAFDIYPDQVDFMPPLVLVVDDCRAAFEEFNGRGVEFSQAPVERYGSVDASFRDPSGNGWKLIQAR